MSLALRSSSTQHPIIHIMYINPLNCIDAVRAKANAYALKARSVRDVREYGSTGTQSI